jgi:NADPH:quinone reductase-like Zn-dependent oxidoreductase
VSALEVGEVAAPHADEDWAIVKVRAAALNHHDLRSLRGIGLAPEQLPMILGCDGAGVTEGGQEVVLHAVISDPHRDVDETLDPHRSLLSEKHPGTFAQEVAVPRRNLVAKPPELDWEHAGAISTAWLTAFRMLFTRASAAPGETVLVQGAGGGLSTAAIALGRAAGLTVWATSRTESRRRKAIELGAEQAFETGARLPRRVDVVIDAVGPATFEHSLRAVRPGGRIVLAGVTSGPVASLDIRRLYVPQIDLLGSTMGSMRELEQLLSFMVTTGVRPRIDSTYALSSAREAFARLASGDAFGKIVLLP